MYFLINGERGVISYYKINQQQNIYQTQLNELKNKNILLVDRILRLQPNTIDLDYLDEQLRHITGFISENEMVISLQK